MILRLATSGNICNMYDISLFTNFACETLLMVPRAYLLLLLLISSIISEILLIRDGSVYEDEYKKSAWGLKVAIMGSLVVQGHCLMRHSFW